VESNENSVSGSISHTENWLNWNGDLDNPNDSKDNCKVDVESDMELDNGMENQENPEQRDATATPNIPSLIWHTQKLKTQAKMRFLMVNAIEMMRNKQIKTTQDRMH